MWSDRLLTQMSLEDMYAQLCAIITTHTEPIEVRREILLMSLQAVSPAHTELAVEEVGWVRGHSPEDVQLEEALTMLPRLRGLVPLQDQTDQENLFTPVCQLLKIIHLRKWCDIRSCACAKEHQHSDGT